MADLANLVPNLGSMNMENHASSTKFAHPSTWPLITHYSFEQINMGKYQVGSQVDKYSTFSENELNIKINDKFSTKICTEANVLIFGDKTIRLGDKKHMPRITTWAIWDMVSAGCNIVTESICPNLYIWEKICTEGRIVKIMRDLSFVENCKMSTVRHMIELCETCRKPLKIGRRKVYWADDCCATSHKMMEPKIDTDKLLKSLHSLDESELLPLCGQDEHRDCLHLLADKSSIV